MNEDQFTALVDLIEAIINENLAENNDAPPGVMLEARQNAEKCRREAHKLLVNPQE